LTALVGGVLITLKIYDILGCEVATLINKFQKAGNYEVTFDASNFTSGIYFYSLATYLDKLQSSNLVESKKMIFGADASNFLFIYYSYIKPQLIMAVLMKYENRLENLNISIEDYSTKNEMIESNKSFIEFSNINSDEKDKHYNKIYNNTLLYLQQSLEITKNNLEKIKESKEEKLESGKIYNNYILYIILYKFY